MRTRAVLTLVACAFLFAVRAEAQRRDPRGSDEGDTIPNARVVVIPANAGYNLARLEGAVKELKVLGVYSTDGPVARDLATKVGASLRGPVQSISRAGRTAEHFAQAITDSLVDKLARANMKHAVVLVADADLVRPMLRAVFKDVVKGSRADRALDDFETSGTYIIFVRANSTRFLAYRP
jgi:hypothetical protein